MKSLLLAAQTLWMCGLLHAVQQCEDTLPDGTICGPEDYVAVADPTSCWKYYECDSGCVTHKECEDEYKFDIAYAWCTFPYDVECGDRPCDDPVHCPTAPPPPTTAEPDCTPPDQIIDCKDYGAGYFPDEHNCRKYWHCIKGESDGEHLLCPDDQDGNPEMYDLTYGGCNYAYLTKCNGRPICDECNENCDATPTQGPDCTPEEQKINCKDVGPGWFPDQFNCRRYWHCLSADAEPEHLLCEDDSQGNPEMFDLVYNGCNFAGLTQCGERPVCDECNDNCVDSPTPPPYDCGHDLDCSSKPDGWYADPYSCKKYWHCTGGVGQHLMCDGNLMYEPVKIMCDYPERVNCGNRPPCNECEDGCP